MKGKEIKTMTDREKAIEICKRLSFCADLTPDADDEDPDFLDGIYDELGKEFGDFVVAHGATKGVLIFNNLPFVIKFPFHGIRYYDYDKEDQGYDDCYSIAEFGGAECEEYNNYCQCELERADAIVEAGFGEFVAKTELLYVNEFGYKFYIQEKVQDYLSYYNPTSHPSAESQKKSASLDLSYKYCSEDWRAFVIDTYGEEKWMKFVDWARCKYHNFFNDMHSGNFGYRYDGTPVLLDISGFND